MLRQSQQQKLLQRMSPQQIQFLKLLRVPTVDMEQRIKDEMEINPALEYQTQDAADDPYSEPQEDLNSQDEPQEEVMLQDDNADQIDIDDYLRNENDDGWDYGNGGEQERTPISAHRYEADFHESLLEQLQMLSLNDKERQIAEQVIGSINDDGYLSRSITAMVDDLAFSRSVMTDEAEIKSIIRKIQMFDPPGIGAYTLQECLILQLRRIGSANPASGTAIEILDRYYDAFIKKHYDKIKKSLHLTEDAFREALDLILKLNPKPGATFESGVRSTNFVLPDFFIENDDDNIEISLNSKNAPELRISGEFREMLQTYDKGDKKDKKNIEAVTFIKQKLDSAQWFINSIKQRQTTLLQTMQAIVNFQREFFLTGDPSTLRPMILKDIAEITKQDMSTVSRVANSKYVQTQFGTFSLKHFFSEKITMETGEEVTNKEVKSIVLEIINGEDKARPLRDEDITDLLLKKGYNISRRTIAKYREQLLIPVARLRKL